MSEATPLSLEQLKALQQQRATLDQQLKQEEKRRNRQAAVIGWAFLENFERNKDSFARTCLDWLHRTLTDEKQRREAGLQELLNAMDTADKRPGPISSMERNKAAG